MLEMGAISLNNWRMFKSQKRSIKTLHGKKAALAVEAQKRQKPDAGEGESKGAPLKTMDEAALKLEEALLRLQIEVSIREVGERRGEKPKPYLAIPKKGATYPLTSTLRDFGPLCWLRSHPSSTPNSQSSKDP